MKAKLVVEGKEFDIEISDPELQELVASKKQTGYERVAEGEYYYTCDVITDQISEYIEKNVQANDRRYKSANYYSDKTVAENNARADMLMRQLRRFAVEHRKKDINWKSIGQNKYNICYDSGNASFYISEAHYIRGFGLIPFNSKETAQLAIDTFYDELIWYFTEYKDSL